MVFSQRPPLDVSQRQNLLPENLIITNGELEEPGLAQTDGANRPVRLRRDTPPPPPTARRPTYRVTFSWVLLTPGSENRCECTLDVLEDALRSDDIQR